MQRFEQGEDLSEMAFKVVFEHLDYFQEIREDVEIIEKLMKAEIENKLPKLEAFRSNAEILANHYINAMDNYLEFAYDVKNWLTDNFLEEKFNFLSKFCDTKGLNSDKEKESMLEIVSEWNELAGNKIADYILYKKETEIISKEDLNNMVDVALKYNPNCVDALKLKIDYLKMKRIK